MHGHSLIYDDIWSKQWRSGCISTKIGIYSQFGFLQRCRCPTTFAPASCSAFSFVWPAIEASCSNLLPRFPAAPDIQQCSVSLSLPIQKCSRPSNLEFPTLINVNPLGSCQIGHKLNEFKTFQNHQPLIPLIYVHWCPLTSSDDNISLRLRHHDRVVTMPTKTWSSTSCVLSMKKLRLRTCPSNSSNALLDWLIWIYIC